MSVKSIGSFGELVYNYLKRQKVKAAQLCPTVCDPMDYSPWNSPGQNTGVGSLSLLQGIFPTQGSNQGLLHCRWILYQLKPQGKPKNTGVGSLSLLQQIFPTQELNWGLLYCRQILYQLSYVLPVWITTNCGKFFKRWEYQTTLPIS